MMTTDKAPDAFRTISEAADDLDLPQHVLRFWETRFSQIKPLKRGGGRRYYRPDDIDFLRGLKHLLHAERYTIKGVQKIIKEQGIKTVQNAWRVPDTAPVHAIETRETAPAVAAQPVPVAPMAAPRPGLASASAPSIRSKLEAALAELSESRRSLASLKEA
jgi:DNA-binding transcriptional MerR regulator